MQIIFDSSYAKRTAETDFNNTGCPFFLYYFMIWDKINVCGSAVRIRLPARL